MNSYRQITVRIGKTGLLVAFLLVLLAAAVGCGVAAKVSHPAAVPDQTSGMNLSTRCQNQSDRQPPEFSNGEVPDGQPILVGPIVVGCGKRLGEPIRFIAYVQATGNGGEQLCYALEQKGQKAVTGGSCFQTAPSLVLCSEECPLSVEATVARWGRQASKGSLVTGAVSGAVQEVALSTEPIRGQEATLPFMVVLKGSVRKKLRLPSAVSLFASAIVPCIPARQEVYARVQLFGRKEVSMQGSYPFGCQE